MAKRGKADPDVIFKVRHPKTGLFLGAKGSAWTKKSWSRVGTNYPTAERARAAAEHYILNETDDALEVVPFRITPLKVEPVDLPPLDRVRELTKNFLHNRPGDKPLWHALSNHGFATFIFERTKAGLPLPKHYVWVRGWPDGLDQLNLAGAIEKGKVHDRKRLIIGLDDDAALVALKLVVDPADIIQVWDKDANLIEGSQWAIGD